MKKIAICIPTYNRKKVLKDICTKILNIVDSTKFDIYVYDSSTSYYAEEEFKELFYYDNFFYVKVPENKHSSEKLYDIYTNEYICNHYNYLWILPDYFFFSQEVINMLLKKVDEEWDMVMLDFYDPEKKGNRQYHDPNQIFYEYAWSLTQFGIVVLNCETVLKKADWNYFRQQYLNEKYRNFFHVIMYFEIMIQIKDLKFYHYSIPNKKVYMSKYKKGKSEYFEEFIKIWGYCWYESICVLPDYYTNKNEVIKKACIYTGSLNKQNLAELRIRKILTLKLFMQYRYLWKVVSTVPVYEIWLLVMLPEFIVKSIAEFGSIKNYIMIKIFRVQLKIFCSRFKKLYLYGAGIKAGKMAEYLDKKCIPFIAFVVTDSKSNKKDMYGHTVIDISKLPCSTSIGIILALNEQHKKEVVPLLHEKGYNNLFLKNII